MNGAGNGKGVMSHVSDWLVQGSTVLCSCCKLFLNKAEFVRHMFTIIYLKQSPKHLVEHSKPAENPEFTFLTLKEVNPV